MPQGYDINSPVAGFGRGGQDRLDVVDVGDGPVVLAALAGQDAIHRRGRTPFARTEPESARRRHKSVDPHCHGRHDGDVSDLRWDDIKDWFDPAKNGSVPDLVVADTTLDDWQALITLIHTAGWRAEYEYRDHRGELPTSAR